MTKVRFDAGSPLRYQDGVGDRLIQGIKLVGRNGLLGQLTRNVLETALDAEMTEHLGYDKHDPVGRVSGGNSRSGTRPKTVFTEIGPVEIEVAGDDSLRQRLEITNRRNRELFDENRWLRRQFACALGRLRADTGRHQP